MKPDQLQRDRSAAPDDAPNADRSVLRLGLQLLCAIALMLWSRAARVLTVGDCNVH